MRRSSSPSSGGSMQIKKDQDIIHISGPPPAKRLLAEDDNLVEKGATAVTGTHIKISNRGKKKEKWTNMILFTRKETNSTFAQYQNISPFKSSIFYL